MIVPANTQRVTSGPTDWIIDGRPGRTVPLLDLRHADGEPEILSLGELARRFGHRDPERRPASWRWVDDAEEEVRDLGDLALLHVATGARLPLAEAPRLLGCGDVGQPTVAAIAGSPASAPLPLARLVPQPATVTDVYTTRKSGPHVPGKSRHWMLRNAARMGARKVGRDWQITPAEYERWLSKQDTKQCATPSRPARGAYETAMRGLATLPKRPTKETPNA
jgi:hypothetical protein